jgi:hypothetical protein
MLFTLFCLISLKFSLIAVAHRWQGTAEVVFSRRSDALAAVKRYNNMPLDGKPMQIEIIGTNIEALPPPTAAFSFSLSGIIKT